MVLYQTDAARSQAADFLEALPAWERGQLKADFHVLERYGTKGPLSTKPIKGHKPMWEVRTLGFRSFFVQAEDAYVVLHICKKQDYLHGIEVAAKRMGRILGG